MTHYIGILDGSQDVWGIRIPDCPGAYGGGETPDKAVANAIEGLAAWAEATLKDGDRLPVPRTLEMMPPIPKMLRDQERSRS
jgi:predicted RNase H-like HicB family nuclease